MFGEIVAIFVVLAIFALVASLVGCYIWLVDRHRFAMWMAILRGRREPQQ